MAIGGQKVKKKVILWIWYFFLVSGSGHKILVLVHF